MIKTVIIVSFMFYAIESGSVDLDDVCANQRIFSTHFHGHVDQHEEEVLTYDMGKGNKAK